MASIDSYLHLIGIELLVILAIVGYLIEADLPKRVVSRLFLTVLGFMLAHFATHALPNKIAGFIYSSKHEYHSIKSAGPHRT
ncbi:hypothetical protein A1353_03805 [Methylomonas methanica]|uniref:Uncharacterized protein n=1 Tax=Methylomonas methanica TaxID=421 RepID=A0A177MV12_METMH|nr:hypothetical protein [Methylomonas methanica]OAI09442.1 hypothetical protein A1353_03805 [Methylomonas methanica]